MDQRDTQEGWYWIKYKNKHNKSTVCPCEVMLETSGPFKGIAMVRTARNDTFIEGPRHGGPGLKYAGKLDKSIRFGSRIEES